MSVKRVPSTRIWKTENKICTIENARFSWVLHVDGMDIPFQYRENAEYFERHYRRLGYKIKHLDTSKDIPKGFGG